MRIDYIARRVILFLLVVWLAATFNFFLPRIGGSDPVRLALLHRALVGGYMESNLEDMVKEYEKKFGRDRPLWQQYISYLGDMSRFDLNYSIPHYPRRVADMMAEAVPWTVGLLGTATLIAFLIGTLVGALLGWPGAPRWVRFLIPPLLTFSAIPYFLLGLILMYLLGFRLKLLPMFGGYTTGVFPSLSLAFALDVFRHAILPAFSIILVSIGGWALSMRGMMVTVQGEDYVTFAEAKGLKAMTIFLRYAVRNAILPQTTGLGLSLGYILSGAVLVEVIFAYPGIGAILYGAIEGSDFFLIQGIVFSIIVALGLALLVMDLTYPLLDPRITYSRA